MPATHPYHCRQMNRSNNEHSGVDAKLLERKAINVHPGDIVVEQVHPIATLLGSCIAVCLYEPRLKIAGMNHFMTPHFGAHTGNQADSAFSGMASMDLLVNAMMKRGAKKSLIIAKAFGGGNLVNVKFGATIGSNNIEFTESWLANEGIPLLASDLGGNWARKIVFNPHDGDVYCRQIQQRLPQLTQLAQAEAEYEAKLEAELKARRIDYW